MHFKWMFFILMFTNLVFSAPSTQADVAPLQVTENADNIFASNSSIIMDSFAVNVLANVTGSQDIFSYVLINPTNTTINQTVIVPVFCEPSCLQSAVLYVNNTPTPTYQGYVSNISTDIAQELPYSDSDLPGYLENLTFLPFSNLNITLDFFRMWYKGGDTSNIIYFYSAQTARYWNQTDIRLSQFFFKYQDALYKNYTYEGPTSNITLGTDNTTGQSYVQVLAQQTNWDGNATFQVSIDTGVTYQPIGPPQPMPLNLWDIFYIVIACAGMGLIIFLGFHYNRRKKNQSVNNHNNM